MFTLELRWHNAIIMHNGSEHTSELIVNYCCSSEHTSELIVNYCSSELSIFTSPKYTEERNEKVGLEEWRKLNSNPLT
jgi:hypothetical protein